MPSNKGRRYGLILCWGVLGLVLGCTSLQPAAPTPLVITATPQRAVVIVTATFTPSPSPVLAPTLPGTQLAADSRALLTQGPPTATPSPAITNTPTFTPTPSDTPPTPNAPPLSVGGAAGTLTADSCSIPPQGGFATIFQANPEIAAQLGCPLGPAQNLSSAFQTYERGAMIWAGGGGSGGIIFAIYANGSYQRFSDTWQEGLDPVSNNLAPPEGLIEPIRGFGKVWREGPGVSQNLGWANSGENGGSAALQTFERGEMLFNSSSGQTYILLQEQSSWISLAQGF